MANRIKNCRHHDCYCKPKKATHSASPPPPALDLELLQRYVRLRDNGKFLNLEINCSDGSTRSVHKFVLNSLSVNLGRSILACKYILNYILHINLLARVPKAIKVLCTFFCSPDLVSIFPRSYYYLIFFKSHFRKFSSNFFARALSTYHVKRASFFFRDVDTFFVHCTAALTKNVSTSLTRLKRVQYRS